MRIRDVTLAALLILPSAGVGAEEASPSPEPARWHWGAGVGLESRLQREVNPGFARLTEVGQLFQQISFARWGVALEESLERRDSGEGALRVQTRSLGVTAWARYFLGDSSGLGRSGWKPYLGVGGGAFFDRVDSTYAGLRDRRSGNRPLIGGGGGLQGVFYDVLLFEVEARAVLVRDRREPLPSLLFRMGARY